MVRCCYLHYIFEYCNKCRICCHLFSPIYHQTSISEMDSIDRGSRSSSPSCRNAIRSDSPVFTIGSGTPPGSPSNRRARELKRELKQVRSASASRICCWNVLLVEHFGKKEMKNCFTLNSGLKCTYYCHYRRCRNLKLLVQVWLKVNTVLHYLTVCTIC